MVTREEVLDQALAAALLYDRCSIGLATGTGKCLAKDTKILLYDGTFRNVQDVREGDLLMGVDSTPRRVLSSTKGRQMMYTISQNKGESYRVNEDHILSLKFTDTNTKRKLPVQIQEYRYKETNIYNIPVLVYLSLPKSVKHNLKGYKAPCIQYSEKPVLVDPYFIGLWLGDGSNRGIEITNVDSEITEWLDVFAKESGLVLRVNKDNGITYRLCMDKKTHPYTQPYRILNIQTGDDLVYDSAVKANTFINSLTGGKGVTAIQKHAKEGITGDYWVEKLKRTSTNHLVDKFKSLDLFYNKHIPQCYKINSEAVRLQILAGLIDSDGCAQNGGYEIASCNKILAEDITYVARSLGFYVNMRQKTAIMGEYRNENCYRITIWGNDLDRIPIKVLRKKIEKSYKKGNPLHTGVQVTKDCVDDYYGFVINKDHLFIINDFTVTHNTKLGYMYLDKFYTGTLKVLVVAPRISIFTSWKDEAQKWGYLHILDRITFSTYLSLDKQEQGYDIIILDEIHNLTLAHKEYLSAHKGLILGLSGTLPKYHHSEKGMMVDAFAPAVYSYSTDEAVENNILNDYRIIVHPLQLSTLKDHFAKTKTGGWMTSEQLNYEYWTRRLQESRSKKEDQIMRIMRMKALQSFKTKENYAKRLLNSTEDKCIVFADTQESAERLCGYSYHSNNPDSESNLELFKKDKVKKLSAVNQLSEGVTIPGLRKAIVLSSYSGNSPRTSQKLGRILRLNPDEIACLDILVYSGTQDEIWVRQVLEDYNPEKISWNDLKISM